jgi:hypothetical protein
MNECIVKDNDCPKEGLAAKVTGLRKTSNLPKVENFREGSRYTDLIVSIAKGMLTWQ